MPDLSTPDEDLLCVKSKKTNNGCSISSTIQGRDGKGKPSRGNCVIHSTHLCPYIVVLVVYETLLGQQLFRQANYK